jgi:hypothetical protein
MRYEYGAPLEWYGQGTTELLGGKTVTVPLCTPLKNGVCKNEER